MKFLKRKDGSYRTRICEINGVEVEITVRRTYDGYSLKKFEVDSSSKLSEDDLKSLTDDGPFGFTFIVKELPGKYVYDVVAYTD